MRGSGTGEDLRALHTEFSISLQKGEDSAFAWQDSTLRTNRRHQACRIHLKGPPYPLSSRKTREKEAGEVVKDGAEEEVDREGEMEGWVSRREAR